MSIKPLQKLYRLYQIIKKKKSAFALPLTQGADIYHVWVRNSFTNSLFSYTVLFLSSSHSYYHRNTGMKVYSSYINTDVYGSKQNSTNPLLKVTGALNNVCVDCIVSPLGGDRWLLKKCHWIILSRDSFKNADSSSNETSGVFMSESLHHSFKPLFR